MLGLKNIHDPSAAKISKVIFDGGNVLLLLIRISPFYTSPAFRSAPLDFRTFRGLSPHHLLHPLRGIYVGRLSAGSDLVIRKTAQIAGIIGGSSNRPFSHSQRV